MQKICYLLFLLFLSQAFQIITTQEDPRNVCREYMRKGMEEKLNRNYIIALEDLSKAEILAETHAFDDWLWYIQNNIGLIYSGFSNYGEALDYYLKAIEVIERNEYLKKDKAVVLTNIAILYSTENNTEQALEYFNKAYSVSKEYSADAKTEKAISINIANQYIKLGRAEKARSVLEETREEINDTRIDYRWNIALARTYLLTDDLGKAKELAVSLMPKINKVQEWECYICITELMTLIYSEENDLVSAIGYAISGLQHTSNLNDKINFYTLLSDLYLKSEEVMIALQYKDSVIIAKDSLSASINRGLYETNKARFKVQEYQNEININKNKQRAERKLFGTSIIAVLIIGFFVYKTLKNRVIKHKQQKVIAENNEKIVSLELEKLRNDIAQKNRKLTTKALYMSGRNELIQDIIQSLSGIKEVSESKAVNDYIKTLKNHLKTDKEWEEFILHFEEVNPHFLETIKAKHPDLNNNDLRFICYTFMNLNLKEISIIFNITYNAARIRKRRILEKMGLDKDTSLYDHIMDIRRYRIEQS